MTAAPKIFLWYDIVQDNFVLALPGLPQTRLPWSKELDVLANQALGKFAEEVGAAKLEFGPA